MNERILIQGIGGIGGVVAGRMVEAGFNPVLVTNNQDITDAIMKEGIRITSPEGSAVIKARAYTYLEDMPGGAPFDVAYLIMKAESVVEAARVAEPLLKPDGFVVTCQNGIVEDAVATVIEPARIVSAIVGWGGTMHAPGVYERTSTGSTHIGELDGQMTRRLQMVEEHLSTAAPVEVTDNIRGKQWAKLAINCTITTFGALTGELLGTMLKDKHIRLAFMQAYAEVIDTALALDIKLEAIAANPMTLYVRRDAGPMTRAVKHLIVRYVGRKYGRLKSSSLQSLLRGRKTEIDYLNGYVVDKAASVGVPVPVNERLVALTKQIESGERQIQSENVDTLLEVVSWAS